MDAASQGHSIFVCISLLIYSEKPNSFAKATLMTKSILSLLTVLILVSPAYAQDAVQSTTVCAVSDKSCLMKQLERTAEDIDNDSWKDKVYRELAKSYTYEGLEDNAIALIDKITNPDTKAMTIRGIGFAAADSKWEDRARYNGLFAKLTDQASTIDHPPSHGIALTYIAMAQAFAGDNDGATATAKTMENDALRHKAFGESAEIQAERGEFEAAMASIGHIDDLAFRNKAHRIISKIFVQKDMMNQAYDAAMKIENAYMQAEAIQFILNADNPEEHLDE